MNKKRVIRLKDPRLRGIRFNLRTILEKEVTKRMIDLMDLKGIELKRIVDMRNLYGSESAKLQLLEKNFDKQYGLLEDKINKLRALSKRSICSCAQCTDMKKDHIFNPVTKEWYCEKCYSVLKRGYAKRGITRLFP